MVAANIYWTILCELLRGNFIYGNNRVGIAVYTMIRAFNNNNISLDFILKNHFKVQDLKKKTF